MVAAPVAAGGPPAASRHQRVLPVVARTARNAEPGARGGPWAREAQQAGLHAPGAGEPEWHHPIARGERPGTVPGMVSESLDAQGTLTVRARAVDTAEGPLARLRALQALLDAAAEASTEAVSAARADGKTWQEVGDALGISRQAAQQRCGRRPPPSSAPATESAVSDGSGGPTSRSGASGAPTPAPPTSAKTKATEVAFRGWSLLVRFRRH